MTKKVKNANKKKNASRALPEYIKDNAKSRRRAFLEPLARECKPLKKSRSRLTLVPVRELAKRAEKAGHWRVSLAAVYKDLGPRRPVQRQERNAAKERARYRMRIADAACAHLWGVS